jgi:hypothetical protein
MSGGSARAGWKPALPVRTAAWIECLAFRFHDERPYQVPVMSAKPSLSECPLPQGQAMGLPYR